MTGWISSVLVPEARRYCSTDDVSWPRSAPAGTITFHETGSVGPE